MHELIVTNEFERREDEKQGEGHSTNNPEHATATEATLLAAVEAYFEAEEAPLNDEKKIPDHAGNNQRCQKGYQIVIFEAKRAGTIVGVGVHLRRK